ncbi:hypothetical protein AAC387_Pa04g1697 [Persea americana]
MEKSLDRVSNLPDSLLHYILSLMPLKSSIRTSSLSSRWRYLWKYVCFHTTTLDFGMEFPQNQTPEEFAAMVNRYLQLHDGKKIETFRLFFDPGVDYLSDTEKWIEFTVMKGVKELDLDFIQPLYESGEVTTFKLPDCFFDCQSLTHLNLSNCHFSLPLNFNGFSLLKCLKLKQVDITDDMVATLISSCPLLVELTMRECYSLGCIKISGPNIPLKFLAVIACYTYDIEISAPNLQSFHFCGDLSYGYSFNNIPSLVDALFNSTGYECTEPEHDYIKILSDLDCIKVLTLCTGALLHITTAEEYRSEELPISLYNLQELQLLMWSLSDEYLSYIYGFLKHCICPCLEKLFIDLPSAPEIPYEYEYYMKPPLVEEPSECTLSQLKVIKISGLKGHCNEMRLLKFLLEKAIILEKVVLVMAATSEKDLRTQSESIQMPLLSNLRERLLLLPKASSGAQIVLCEYSEDDNSLCPKHTDVYCKP